MLIIHEQFKLDPKLKWQNMLQTGTLFSPTEDRKNKNHKLY